MQFSFIRSCSRAEKEEGRARVLVVQTKTADDVLVAAGVDESAIAFGFAMVDSVSVGSFLMLPSVLHASYSRILILSSDAVTERKRIPFAKVAASIFSPADTG
jgi:hypothetical protein